MYKRELSSTNRHDTCPAALSSKFTRCLCPINQARRSRSARQNGRQYGPFSNNKLDKDGQEIFRHCTVDVNKNFKLITLVRLNAKLTN